VKHSGHSQNPPLDFGHLSFVLREAWTKESLQPAVQITTAQRDCSKPEQEVISKGAQELGVSSDQAFALLGAKTLDIYLNDVAYWSNVLEKVWEYAIAGCQVIKKWLSYREERLLGRPLTKDEVRYVREMTRRIAAILLLTPALDANYQAIKADTFPWTV